MGLWFLFLSDREILISDEAIPDAADKEEEIYDDYEMVSLVL